MKRISIVGTSGSGKSRLARKLAARLGVPHLELDAVYHQKDWQPLAEDEFRNRVAAITSGDAWVVDGNYGAVRDLIWSRADTVVWLDLPRFMVMRQIVWRTIRRVASRAELWNGNRERWRNLFVLDPEGSVIVWAWTSHRRIHDRYLQASLDRSDLRFVRLRSRAEINALLAVAGHEPRTSSSSRTI